MVLDGYQWLLLVISGYCWLLVVIVGYQWLLLVIGGYCWLSVVIVGYHRLFFVVPHHTQRSKENGMVYIPYTQGNMDIFQDIKVKTGKYGYFPGSGKVALVLCPHLPTRRK